MLIWPKTKVESRGLNERVLNFMNTDMSWSTLADLPAVKTELCTIPEDSILSSGYPLSDSSSTACGIISWRGSAYWPSIWTNGLSEETGKTKPLTHSETWDCELLKLIKSPGAPKSPRWLSSLEFKFFSSNTITASSFSITSASLNPYLNCWGE